VGALMVAEGLILGDVINSGIFSVGPTLGGSGLVVSGDFSQNSNGLLQLELADVDSYDTLSVGGTLTAGGSFRALLSGSYMPEADDQFSLLSFGSASGAFAAVDLPTLGQGLMWDASGLLTSGMLKVLSAVSSGNWAVDADGNWSGSTNWTPSQVPMGVGSTANLGDVITSARKVTFDQDVTISSLAFDSPYGYTVFDGTGFYELTLDADSGGASIDVVQGDHLLDAKVNIASNLVVDVFSGSLELGDSEPLNLNGYSLRKIGMGTLRLSGTTGGGNVIVQQGQLFFNGTHLGGGFYGIGVGALMVAEGLILGDVINSGIFSVGPTFGGSGLVVSGDFSQNSNGLLQLELAGVDSYDTLSVGGMLTAGGSFQAMLSGDYVPEAGDQFSLLSFGAASGAFATVDLPTLGQGLIWDASGLLTSGMLEVLLAVLLGDANNDNQVTGADLVIAQQNFGNVDPNMPTDGLLYGDANDDGQVTGADLIIVQQNFGNTLGPVDAVVPESGSVILLGLGWIGLHCTRRRSSRSEVRTPVTT